MKQMLTRFNHDNCLYFYFKYSIKRGKGKNQSFYILSLFSTLVQLWIVKLSALDYYVNYCYISYTFTRYCYRHRILACKWSNSASRPLSLTLQHRRLKECTCFVAKGKECTKSKASSSAAPSNDTAWNPRRNNEANNLARSVGLQDLSSRHFITGTNPDQNLGLRYSRSLHRAHTWAKVLLSPGVKYKKNFPKKRSSVMSSSHDKAWFGIFWILFEGWGVDTFTILLTTPVADLLLNREGLSGGTLEPPQNTLVTLSMTLVLPPFCEPLFREWCLLPRKPKPLIRFDNSALARSTTPCADIATPLHIGDCSHTERLRRL